MIDTATLEKQVLSLDIRERGHLAAVLLRSLDDENAGDENLSHEEIEKLWFEEAARRSKEWDENPSIGIPGDEVLREMRALLK